MKLWPTKPGIRREDVEEAPGSLASSVLVPAIHAILYYASLAPSGHNAQPWKVRVDNGELWIGTFVENLIVAAPAYGYVADCHIVGTSVATEIVRVRLTPGARVNAPLEKLSGRRTIRSGHAGRELSGSDVEALAPAAGADRVHFFTAMSREGRFLAEVTLEANRLQTARDDAQAELAEWMRWTPADGCAHRNGFTFAIS